MSLDLQELHNLKTGDHFTHRGAEYVFAGSKGWTWGVNTRGEFARFRAWNTHSRLTWVTVDYNPNGVHA